MLFSGCKDEVNIWIITKHSMPHKQHCDNETKHAKGATNYVASRGSYNQAHQKPYPASKWTEVSIAKEFDTDSTFFKKTGDTGEQIKSAASPSEARNNTSSFMNISAIRLSNSSCRPRKNDSRVSSAFGDRSSKPYSAKSSLKQHEYASTGLYAKGYPYRGYTGPKRPLPSQVKALRKHNSTSLANNNSSLSFQTYKSQKEKKNKYKPRDTKYVSPYSKKALWFTRVGQQAEIPASRPQKTYQPPETYQRNEVARKDSTADINDSTQKDEGLSSHQLERKRIQRLISSHKWDACGKPDLYIFGHEMGKGSFGVVKLAHHKITGHKVAIKVYDKTKFKKASQIKRCRQEISLMAKLNSSFVVHLFEAFENSKKIYLVMEALSGGNLCTYVKSKKYLHEDEALSIFAQIALALEYLHESMGVVHRDIKLENILFTKHRKVKVADFGFSVFVAETDECKSGESWPINKRCLRSFCGTPSYMAPEIIRKKGYEGFPVDVWSFGVVFYAMLYGRFPFRAKNHEDLYKLILTGKFLFPESREGTVSQASKHLLRQMICLDVYRRITVKGILMQEKVSSAIEDIMNSKKDTEKGYTLSKNSSVSSSINSLTGTVEPRNPAAKIDDNLLKQLVRFGFSYHRLRKHILNRERDHITATYYLLRLKQAKKQ